MKGKKVVVGIVLVMASMLGDTAQAEEADNSNTKWFLEKCEANPEQHALQRSFCLGFLAGFMVMNGVAANLADTPDFGICVPPDVNPDQLRVAVLKYAKDHPESLKGATGVLTLAALMKAFPCPHAEKGSEKPK